MNGLKKLIAILLVASLIFTSNAMYIFAEGNQNELQEETEVILEPSSDNSNFDDFDDFSVISTNSNIYSTATGSEMIAYDEEDSSNIEYDEEPEDDSYLENTSSESENEIVADTIFEEENSNEASSSDADTTTEYYESSEDESSEELNHNDEIIATTSELVDEEESSSMSDSEPDSEYDNQNIISSDSEILDSDVIIDLNEDIVSTSSEIDEIIISTSSNMLINEELFGTGEWIWWIIDDSDPDNITLHYYSAQPTEYSTTESIKKGKAQNNNVPSINYQYTSSIKTIIFENPIVANQYSCTGWFNGLTNLTTITNISNLDTSAVTSMVNMFRGCTSITNIDLHELDTSSVTNMSHMFQNCTNLSTVDISGLNTENVTDMSYMFDTCSNLSTINLTGLNASHVTNMSYMFNNCTNLTNIDVSSLSGNVSTNMQYMFNGCSALTTANITGLFSNSVINITASYMFKDCTSLTSIDLSAANTGTIKSVSYMFDGCSSLTSVNFANANAVTSMTNLFRNCTALTSVNFTNFGSTSITSYSSAFEGCQNIRNLNLSSNLAAKINNTKLSGNWKKSGENTVYEYTSNKTTIPTEAGEYVRVFKLTFDCKGGNALTPVYKEYNGSITLVNPARPGFTFAGWYNEEAYTNAITQPLTITGDKTIYAKWSGGEGATLIYWGIGKANNSSTGKYRHLYLSTRETSITAYSTEYRGSFANTADFNSETDVPWHAYRNEIQYISATHANNAYFNCKSLAYWFKDMTRLKSGSFLSQLTNHNSILENASHIFDGCTNITSANQLFVSNAFKNMDSAFKNCTKLRYLHIQRLSGTQSNSINVELDNNGFKNAFLNCTSLRRMSLRYIDFSNYTGDVFSFNGLTSLVKVRVKNSGNLFNRVNLSGEWWEHDSGQKYTSANMPTNVRQIRKYETFLNTIYWYIQGNDVHLSSTRPSNSNYKEGHYFNGDEANTYGMLPLDVPDNNRIVLDNTITLRNSAGSCFFTNISDAIEIVNLNGLNTSEVTEMDMMFDSMQITNLDLSSFDTSKVTNMNWMFGDCENLTTLDLSSFNTSKVTDMEGMFYGCSSLNSVRLNSFKTSKVEYFDSMFEGCTSLETLDLSSFSTTRLGGVGTDYNEDYIWLMFNGCENLRTIYVSESFVITCDPDFLSINDVFTGCEQLVGGNGTTYDSSHVYADYARIDRAGTPGYFTLGGQGYIAPTNGGGNSDDGGSSSDDSGNNSGNNGGSSSGSSGGSGGGGGGSIAAIDNQINNMMNALNLYTPATIQVSTTKSINNNNSLNGDTSSWAKDPVSGKWKLTAINANGQSVNANNGFYQVNSTVTQFVNNTAINSIAASTYYFDQNGNMVTGWVQTSDNKWYFFDNYKNANEGKMVTGWRVVGNNWYYFMPDGSMLQSGMTPDGYIVGADGAYIV